jgi:hypothetical protein
MKNNLPILPFSSEDFNWCVKNDFQVYATHDPEGNLRVAIRRGGISTEGKDYLIINNSKKTSKEMLGEIIYKNMNELSLYLPAIYKQIIEQYG